MPIFYPFHICAFALIALFLTFTFPNWAEAQPDYVKVSRKLSDGEFYRLVACGAAPGGECQQRPAKWPARDAMNLTVGITEIDPGFPKSSQRKARAAVSIAIEEINATRAALNLKLVTQGNPLVSITLVDTSQRPMVPPSGNWALDVERMSIGATHWTTRQQGRISKCDIRISSELDRGIIRSIILEEMVQCLGLSYDIWGKAYLHTSIFSDRSNRIIRLVKQDAVAIRMHYPAN